MKYRLHVQGTMYVEVRGYQLASIIRHFSFWVSVFLNLKFKVLEVGWTVSFLNLFFSVSYCWIPAMSSFLGNDKDLNGSSLGLTGSALSTASSCQPLSD